MNADMKYVNSFIQADLFNSKFYPKAPKLCQNENCNKPANNANKTICISINTIIPL